MTDEQIKEVIEKIKGGLRVLFTPACWIQNGSYCRVWDRKLNELMQKYKFTDYDGYIAKLGDFEIWVANHPYASMTDFGLKRGLYPFYQLPRPSRITILRAHDKFKRDIAEVYGARYLAEQEEK